MLKRMVILLALFSISVSTALASLWDVHKKINYSTKV